MAPRSAQATPPTQDNLSHLGTMVWFKDFLSDFSSLTEPLTRLLIKDSRWTWGKEQEEAISILIHLVTTSPVLKNSLILNGRLSCIQMQAILLLADG
jgi:hypothetical protein